MTGVVRQGVVLAAGRGTRLQPLSGICPKPLLPVCNKPIMQYQLEAMRQAGIRDVGIVIGPTGGSIRQYFSDGQRLGMRIEYLEDLEPAGIAASLARVEAWVQGPFAVFLGDIFLALDDLTPALTPLAEGAAGTVLVCVDTPEAVRRNFAVVADADRRIRRVIEKPTNPPTDLKGCGVYVFDQTIFEAIRHTPRSPLRNEYEITEAVQNLIEMGRPVYATSNVRWDVNVTYPKDLIACNLRLLRERQLDSLVGEGARISPHARLIASVVGERAVVEGPVVLEECLVLPDAHVAWRRHPARRRIFADGSDWSAEGTP